MCYAKIVTLRISTQADIFLLCMSCMCGKNKSSRQTHTQKHYKPCKKYRWNMVIWQKYWSKFIFHMGIVLKGHLNTLQITCSQRASPMINYWNKGKLGSGRIPDNNHLVNKAETESKSWSRMSVKFQYYPRIVVTTSTWEPVGVLLSGQ